MRILISYPTNIGTFYLGQSKNKKYHPIFNDESLGEYSSVQDAVDSLVNNTNKIKFINPDTKEIVDTSTLGILSDYTQWDSIY